MLRLTVLSESGEETAIKVEGWVSEGDVALLEEEGTRLLQQSQRLILELNGVQFIDREGIALLERWSRKDVVLHGGSLFVRGVLKKHGLV